jgi:peptide/nickel transport system permease protein
LSKREGMIAGRQFDAPHLRRLSWRRHGLLALGCVLVLLVLGAALFADIVAPYSPYDLDVASMLQSPSRAHWLGTDELGRDVFSRTIYAARISVEVALVAVGVGLIGGTVIGILSAYFGGVLDLGLMRLMELLFSFPAILLAIVLMASLGTSILNAMIAIGIIFIPGFSRLARAATQNVLRQQYVVEAAVAFAYAVLLESALSFLGLGAQPPEPSWGNMLNTGRGFMAQDPWLGIVPGLAMFLCVLGFNLLGDGVRDLFDPHLRE